MKLLYTWLLLTCFNVCCFAQTNFKPGYVVRSGTDTLKGFVNYREWELNPETINFKTSLATTAENYTPSSLLGFGVYGSETYRSFELKISTDEVRFERLTIGMDTNAIIKKVFLREIATGSNLILYSYNDDTKKRFFIQSPANKVPYELIRCLYYSNDQNREVMINTRYRLQLSQIAQLLNAPEKVINNIQYADYRESNMVKIVDVLNGNTGHKTSSMSGSRFFVGAGVGTGSIKFSGITPLDNVKSNTAVLPQLSFGIDLLQNKNIGRWELRLEIEAWSGSFNATASNVPSFSSAVLERNIKHITGTFKPRIIYNAYHTAPLKVFIDLGAGLNVSSYSKNVFTRNYTDPTSTQAVTEKDLETLWFSFYGKTGVLIDQRYEIFAGYTIPSNMISYVNSAAKFSAVSIGVHYLFGNTN